MVVTYAYAGVMSFIILKVLSGVFGGMRITNEEESTGLDQSQHGEEGYSF